MSQYLNQGIDFFEKQCLFIIKDKEDYHKGTAFLICKSGLALTCNHVIEDLDEPFPIICYSSREEEEKERSGEVLYKDEKLDFALIKIKEEEGTIYTHPLIALEPEIRKDVKNDIRVSGFIEYTHVDSRGNESIGIKHEHQTGIYREKKEIGGLVGLKIEIPLDEKKLKIDRTGMSGGPIWDLNAKRIIGIIKHMGAEQGILVTWGLPISWICESFLREYLFKKNQALIPFLEEVVRVVSGNIFLGHINAIDHNLVQEYSKLFNMENSLVPKINQSFIQENIYQFKLFIHLTSGGYGGEDARTLVYEEKPKIDITFDPPKGQELEDGEKARGVSKNFKIEDGERARGVSTT